MQAKLGPLDVRQVVDLCRYLDMVPDPRSRRGRWYSLTAILLVCACAVVAGARSIDELAEWGAQAPHVLLASLGIRHHLLRWRRHPSAATIGRVLQAVDGDALDRAVGSYLTARHRSAVESAGQGLQEPAGDRRPRRVIAVDGKALKGSAHVQTARRHLLSAVTHGITPRPATPRPHRATDARGVIRPSLPPAQGRPPETGYCRPLWPG
ncbi:transposase family protein [Streptomyces celluloflavus]|uniref:transposase family protein n=1 Tax=Streptomyces celluloflavus TaxID=58344 RepID=UPI00368A5ECE